MLARDIAESRQGATPENSPRRESGDGLANANSESLRDDRVFFGSRAKNTAPRGGRTMRRRVGTKTGLARAVVVGATHSFSLAFSPTHVEGHWLASRLWRDSREPCAADCLARV